MWIHEASERTQNSGKSRGLKWTQLINLEVWAEDASHKVTGDMLLSSDLSRAFGEAVYNSHMVVLMFWHQVDLGRL